MLCGCRRRDSAPRCPAASRQPFSPTVIGSSMSSTGIDEPVDLVGHDWGGCHVVNAVMHRPDLVRSWASDVIGLFDRDYVWHDMAQGFQTPEAGEQLVEMMQEGSVQDRAQQLVDLRHSRRRRDFVCRSAGSGDGSGDPGAIPLGPPTGSGRCRTGTRERRRPAGTVAFGHRGPLRRHRRDAASGGRPSRRPD